MKLKEYAAALNKLVDKYGELEVIYGRDDEGNGFCPVVYSPTAGLFEDGNFASILVNPGEKPNVICLN